MLALVKTSVACLLFMLYMIGFYYRKPHIPVRPTKIFQVLTVVAALNALFDLITICTVNHREVVPGQVNLIVHIIYLLSILGFVYLLFVYMRSYLETDLTFPVWVKVVHNLPAVLSVLGILVLPITYEQGITTDYSLGPKAYALYGSLVVYLILILYYCLRYWGILDEEKRLAIVLAVPIYIIGASIQIMIPETLVVIICSTLILLGLILSNENTEKYLDEKTTLFNQYSFEKVLEEFEFGRQKIAIAVLCFCKTEDHLDWKQDELILQAIQREFKQCRLDGYHICENGVVFVGSSKEKARMLVAGIKKNIEDEYGKERVSIETKVLSEENTATKRNCMRSIIAFCTETGSRLAYIDYLTNIYNRNALERDLDEHRENGDDYYFIADLNDLKIVNDTIGHSAGDKLLQGFARLLTDTVGDDGRAYRQGGDEFAVIYRRDAEQFVRELDKQCREYNQSCNIPISYAIGYCKLSDQNFREVADRMMYADKRRIKQQRNKG